MPYPGGGIRRGTSPRRYCEAVVHRRGPASFHDVDGIGFQHLHGAQHSLLWRRRLCTRSASPLSALSSRVCPSAHRLAWWLRSAGSAVKGTRLPMLSGQRSKIGNRSDRGLNSRRQVTKLTS